MILCTFPGKFGDLLWALPTMRALAGRVGEPVALQIPAALESIAPLLRRQPYLASVYADPSWTVLATAPATPRIPLTTSVPDGGTIQIVHLGYRGWPTRALPFETLDGFNAQAWNAGARMGDAELQLQTPWITAPLHPAIYYRIPWVHGFTDEHFELKYGLVELLQRRPRPWAGVPVRIGADPRWHAEAGETDNTWIESVELLRCAGAFLGCNSALHVLAVACGVPVVLMEPHPHRHHPIFYPLGDQGPQVQLVRGTDGNPTFDARHVRAELLATLANPRHPPVDSTPSPLR
jgi:hypothetical protein